METPVPFWNGPWAGMATAVELAMVICASISLVIIVVNLVDSLREWDWIVFSQVNGPRRVIAQSVLINEGLRFIVQAIILALGIRGILTPPLVLVASPTPTQVTLTVLVIVVEGILMFQSIHTMITRYLLRNAINEEGRLLREEIMRGEHDGPKNQALDKALAADEAQKR